MGTQTYPEHDRMAAVSDQAQAIGDFLEWAQSRGQRLAAINRHGAWHPTHLRTEEVLAEYFDIDLDKIAAEKEAMYQALRSAALR